MSIGKKDTINVLNYGDNCVCVSTRDMTYAIDPCSRDGNPSITPFSRSEIESINSRSDVFRSGCLMFEDSDKKEIYENVCRIVDWENILTNQQIEDIIINPTVEGLEKLISINNSAAFERVRGIFFKIKNQGIHDIVNRVEENINRRYQELLRGKTRSEINLRERDVRKPADAKDVMKLKDEIAELKDLIKNISKKEKDTGEKKEEKPKKADVKAKATAGKDTKKTK